MGARNARSRALTIIGFVAVIAFAAVGAHAALTVQGDAAAWKELNAAFKKLLALPAYRVKVTSSTTTTSTVIEVVPPNSYHSLSRTPIETTVWTSELINVNGQIRRRLYVMPGAPGEWECSTDAPPDFTDPFEAGSVNGTVDVSRGPDAVIDGTPVRTYYFRFTQSDTPGQTMKAKYTVYVDKASGLPRRIVDPNASGDFEGITDYYDYGADIVLTLPPCK